MFFMLQGEWIRC